MLKNSMMKLLPTLFKIEELLQTFHASQTVERAVKLTSGSSKKAVSLSKRNNLILAKVGWTGNVLRPKKTIIYLSYCQ